MPSTDTTKDSLSPRREDLLHRITLQIRQSLELQEILETTVVEVRAYLRTDRVKVYRFAADGSGEVIAEALQENRLPSLLGLNFPADDIPPYARELFVKARQRSIVDLTTQQIGWSEPTDPTQTSPQATEDIRYRPVDPCHIEYLTAMQVRSSVVVPILYQEKLWGLLVSHHSERREVTEEELQFIGAVADQVEVAIAQSTLLQQVRQQAEQEAKINQITGRLHKISPAQLQAALEEVVQVFHGSSGRLYLTATNSNQADEFYTCGEQPSDLLPGRPIEQHLMWQQYLRSPGTAVCNIEAEQDTGTEPWKNQSIQFAYAPGGERPDPICWAIKDIYQEPLLRTLAGAFRATQIRGVMIVPLRHGTELLGCLTVFRGAVETEKLWAGRCDNDQRQMMPQMSFEAWRELKQAQAQPWTEDEKKLAQSLGTHFSMAVQQYRLYRQVQSLNANLEHQVQARTSQLQQLVEQQAALSNVVAKIRESLELDVIFQTTTQEVCQLLQADRVAVYRFNPDWSGEFIDEFVTPPWIKLVKGNQQTVWKDTYLQETQGGRYRNNETFAVNDIYQAGHSPCHVEILERFQVRAYAIAPILVGQKLWGLLAAYQNSGPRDWQTAEVNLLAQVAAQFSVAIQQAELLAQTQHQAEHLAQALQELKQTQSQLIQTEKMSSLGQLVAGVAHEINNPVNFIYGNLAHAQEYTQELLDLVQVYQRHYPNPHSEVKDSVEAIDLDFIAQDLPKIMASMRVGSDRIRQIVLSLRNFSRIDQAEVKPVDIHEGIDSTLLILQHRLKAAAERPSIEVVKEYSDLPPVECYAGQLNQVFMNILTNAVDALEEQSRSRSRQAQKPTLSQITVRTELISTQNEPNSRVAVHIIDNGSGMTEEIRSRLFDPFFTTKPVGQGTGLGLAISYQIITEKHGGSLQCISKLGEGTEFIIEIPVQQPAALKR